MKQNSFAVQLVILISAITLIGCSKGAENESSRPFHQPGIGPVGAKIKTNFFDAVVSDEDVDPNSDQAQLKPVLATGKRAIEWLNLINSHRDANSRLNLADKSTKNPVAPENPKVSSVILILQKYNERLQALPPSMSEVILKGAALTDAPSVSDEDFIKQIRELNSSYQNAVRWIGQAPYLSYYAENAAYDIRGFYFLQKEELLFSKLRNFKDLSQETQQKYKDWLVQMCRNSKANIDSCRRILDSTIQSNSVLDFYEAYFSSAQKNFQDFFEVSAVRKENRWNSSKTTLTQDFITPTVQKVLTWLKTNVEEEWKAEGFQLLLNFISDNGFSPFIAFQSGVTPHVTGETANKIVMDPDYSLDDYDTQWTIRHEFGHVMGFPDCYLEFYNPEQKEMTYYTIEPDNLMCAWGGKLQKRHVDELKRAYR